MRRAPYQILNKTGGSSLTWRGYNGIYLMVAQVVAPGYRCVCLVELTHGNDRLCMYELPNYEEVVSIEKNRVSRIANGCSQGVLLFL